MYQLVIADNVELQGYQVKAEYEDPVTAIAALYAEARMAAAERDIEDYYWRFTDLTDLHAISIDYGSWSDFVGLIGVSLADLNVAS